MRGGVQLGAAQRRQRTLPAGDEPDRLEQLGRRGGLCAVGQGRLYRDYLKVEDACEVCGHALGQYRADDGPAYITILLVGHLVVAPLLLFPFIWQWPAAIVVPLTLGPLAALVLMTLPRVKGAFLGALWAIKARHADG